jgi:hypothetical protein
MSSEPDHTHDKKRVNLQDASGAEKKEVKLVDLPQYLSIMTLTPFLSTGARYFDCYPQEEEEAQLVDVSYPSHPSPKVSLGTTDSSSILPPV